jgi:MurNAc alpha-1-phosphate uridylyltransferase
MSSDSIFPVVILAGGQATRLRPVTETIPKCLVEVDGTPFIDLQLRQLAAQGVRKVFLLIGYLGSMVEEHVGTGERYGLTVTYVHDGKCPLGTAGSIRAALHCLPDAFFVLYGDSYLRCSYAEIQRSFLEGGRPILMTVYQNDRQWDTSNVVFDSGRVLKYSKTAITSEMRHIDYGLMVFKRETFNLIAVGEPFDLARLLEDQVEKGNVTGYEVRERFYEIGSHLGLRDLSEFLSASGDAQMVVGKPSLE